MPFISVSNQFQNLTTIDHSKFNTNFNDIVQGLQDGTKDLNISALTCAGAVDLNSTVDLGTQVTYGLPPVAMYRAPAVSMEWSTVAAILVKSGRYFLNNKVYTNSSDITWTWVAAGQNGGLDTGAEASSTWYYMYGTLIGGAFGVVASTTAPTAVFDTNLSGTSFDTNVYLGAFRNDSSSNIIRFWQSINKTTLLTNATVSHTGDTNFTSKTIIIPATASFVIGRISQVGNAGVEGEVSPLSTGSSSEYNIASQVSSIGVFGQLIVPINTAQTVWLKTGNAANTTSFLPLGWIDKWL